MHSPIKYWMALHITNCILSTPNITNVHQVQADIQIVLFVPIEHKANLSLVKESKYQNLSVLADNYSQKSLGPCTLDYLFDEENNTALTSA